MAPKLDSRELKQCDATPGKTPSKKYGFNVFFGGVLVAVVVEVCLSSFGFFVHSPTTAATGQIEAIVG